MNNRRRLRCYVCDRLSAPRQLPHIGPDENHQQVAVYRRNNNELPDLGIDQNTRVCTNCHQSINIEVAEIQADPTCLRLNVMNQRGNRACALCGAENNVIRASLQCRVNIFVQGNIYVPENVRFCTHHLNAKGLMIPELVPGLRSTNRPCRIPGNQMQVFLEQLRNIATSQPRLEDAFESLSEEDFSYLLSLNREQFEELLAFCDPVPEENGMRYVKKKILWLIFAK